MSKVNYLLIRPTNNRSGKKQPTVCPISMDFKYKDAYEQLGLSSSGASWDEVRTSYRRKVQRLHPDRQQPENAAESQDEFIRVTRAYKLLNEYHRANDDLPRDYQTTDDPAMQVNLGEFDKVTYKDLAGVVESIQYNHSDGPSALKIVLLSCALVLVSAMAIMSFASWQKSQVPPITPFTSEKPMPLSSQLQEEQQ